MNYEQLSAINTWSPSHLSYDNNQTVISCVIHQQAIMLIWFTSFIPTYHDSIQLDLIEHHRMGLPVMFVGLKTIITAIN